MNSTKFLIYYNKNFNIFETNLSFKKYSCPDSDNYHSSIKKTKTAISQKEVTP